MKTRRDYDKAIQIVGKIIHDWDPYCLIAEGSPADEFDDEIAKITAKIPSFLTSADAATAISLVFTSSFGEGEQFSPKDCSEPAEHIFSELGRAGLLPAA